MKSINEVLEEVGELIDTHFFNEFTETRSSTFLKRVLENQRCLDLRLLKKTWRSLICTQKTMKVLREIQENLLCVGKRKELITKKRTQTACFCSRTGVQLNAKHIVSCCKKVSAEINARHDIIVNILLNDILTQRIDFQRTEVGGQEDGETARDEITIGTKHWRSDEWKEKTGSPERS